MAAARWDDRAGTLDLVRDRTGLHPLFYAKSGNTVSASTDLRALAATPEVDTTVSAESVAAWLDGRARDSSETLFDTIRRVPPGHIVTFGRDGCVSLRRSWSPPSPRSYARADSMRFGDLLETATDAHAELGRPAVFLSGGLDSAAVAAAAAPANPIALCVDFPGASEAATQRAVGAALGMDFMTIEATVSGALVANALEMARDSLWPTPAVWAPVFEDLAVRARANGAGVLLDGLGGDELLDAGYAAGRELLRRPWHLPAWLRAERRYTGETTGSLRSLLRRDGPSYAEERASDVVDSNLAMQREASFDLGVRTRLPRRHPLWDAAVVDLLNGLPPEALVAGGEPKSPARTYLRRRIPSTGGVWPQPKVANVLAAAVLDDLRRHLAANGTPRLVALGVVNGDDRDTILPFSRIWPMLCLESWLGGVEDWGKGR
jgi:asparagine synthetase B (glutamine-hydrolysing)